MIRAVQIRPKLTRCVVVNGSLNTKIPKRSVMVGARYWKKPIIERGILRAPFANQTNGTAVAIPAPIRSRCVVIEAPATSLVFLKTRSNKNASAAGVRIAVSAVKPVIDPTRDVFRNRP